MFQVIHRDASRFFCQKEGGANLCTIAKKKHKAHQQKCCLLLTVVLSRATMTSTLMNQMLGMHFVLSQRMMTIMIDRKLYWVADANGTKSSMYFISNDLCNLLTKLKTLTPKRYKVDYILRISLPKA